MADLRRRATKALGRCTQKDNIASTGCRACRT
jgi:hypothetical protein